MNVEEPTQRTIAGLIRAAYERDQMAAAAREDLAALRKVKERR